MGDEPNEVAFPLTASASHLLLRALQLAEERFARLAKANGLTLRQFAALAAIQAQPGLSQAELVRATSIDRSTLAEMMMRMEARGLVTRTQSREDQRANAVTITPAGRTALQNSLTHARAADAAILDLLSPPKKKALIATLHRISKRADEQAEKEDRVLRKAARRLAKLEAKAREKAAEAPKKRKRKKRDRTAPKRVRADTNDEHLTQKG